jgi:branched-chain amino acid transport system substrate-binding protein
MSVTSRVRSLFHQSVSVGALAAAFMSIAPAEAQATPAFPAGGVIPTTVYADTQGIGSVIAAQFAVDDYAAKLGVKAEVVSADHQNKVDVGATIACNWYEVQGVDGIKSLASSPAFCAGHRPATPPCGPTGPRHRP